MNIAKFLRKAFYKTPPAVASIPWSSINLKLIIRVTWGKARHILWVTGSQPAFTCSKLTIKTPERRQFLVFHCWLWTCNCRLGAIYWHNRFSLKLVLQNLIFRFKVWNLYARDPICVSKKVKKTITQCTIPAGIYLLKVNNRNTRRCEMCSKLKIDTRTTPMASFWYLCC